MATLTPNAGGHSRRHTMNPLERLRVDRGLNQRALAREAGVSNKTVGAIESGAVREPEAGTVAALARVLEVAPSTLLADLRAYNADQDARAAA